MTFGTEGMGVKEAQKEAGGRWERAVTMTDEIELPSEIETANRDDPKFLSIQLSLDRQAREERNPQVAPDGILDGGVAAEFKSEIQSGERSTDAPKRRFESAARA